MEDIEKKVTEGLEEEAKAPSGEPAKPKETPAVEDPEVELEGGQKVKMSELKKGYMLQSDYTTKTQELAEQRKEVEELRQLAEHLKTNPKKLERIIKILDEKEEEIVEKREDIAEELEGLDPNDPYAKTLKAQSKMLKSVLSEIETMKQERETSTKETLVQQAQQVLVKALEDTAKTYQFEDDEEKSLWRQMVLSYLKDNPKQYKDEADFTNTIKEIGKRYYDTLTKVGEKKISAYLKSKGGQVPTTPTTPGSPLSKKPSMDNLQELIEEELGKEEQTT